MNSKAVKNTLQFPLNYNFAKDETVIDDQFATVESLNTPFLNNMMTPVWTKDLGKKVVYDYKGNGYTVENGYLNKNGNALTEINNNKFVSKNVTQHLISFDAVTLKDGGYYGLKTTEKIRIYKGETLEELESNYNFGFTIGEFEIETNSKVLTSQLKFLNGRLYYIVYYDLNDIGKIAFGTLDNAVRYNSNIVWKKQYVKLDVNADYRVVNVSGLSDANPVIYASHSNGLDLISLVAFRGDCHNTNEQAYSTFIINNNTVLDNPRPKTSSGDMTINVTTRYYYSFRQSVTKTRTVKQCVYKDNQFFPYEEGVIGSTAINFGDSYFPTPLGVDAQGYPLYAYQESISTAKMTILSKEADTREFTVKDIDGHTYTLNLNNATEISGAEYSKSNYGGTYPDVGYEKVNFTLADKPYKVESARFGNQYLSFSVTTSTTVVGGWIVAPNIFIEGIGYTLYAVNGEIYGSNSDWFSYPKGGIVVESGIITSLEGDVYTIEATNSYYINNCNVLRGNSFGAEQSFITSTSKWSNTSASTSYSLKNNGGESTGSLFVETNKTNGSSLRFMPGTIASSTYNYYGATQGDSTSGAIEDLMPFTVGGCRVNLGNNFNLLINTYQANIIALTGISWSSSEDYAGTLLTPVNQIDQNFYIATDVGKCIYRDNQRNYYELTIETGNEINAVADDRFIIINTTSYYNCYDALYDKLYHYASDENGRTLFGTNNYTEYPGASSAGELKYFRYTGTGVNASVTYTADSVAGALIRKDAIAGIILPLAARTRVVIGEELNESYKVPDQNAQAIDIYYSGMNDTQTLYKYSILDYGNFKDKFIKNELFRNYYSLQNSSNPLIPPSIFATYIKGEGNNDMVKEHNSTFTLVYAGTLPVLLYSLSSQSFANFDSDVNFFVIQGQFYAFMNDKIYSAIYSNRVISSLDAIVDCRGMKFLGNNTQISFFFSPSKRAIYSFTGDANLQHLWDASKFKRIGYDDESQYRHWYDEGSQSIYCATDIGLLVFGPKNTYCYEDWKNVTNVQFSNDSVTHITNGDTTYDLVFYPTDGYEVKPLKLETAFFGVGANQSTTIDRWDIVLYDYSGTKPISYVKAGVRSITDITVKSEEKEFKITPDMYDKWGNSILLRYVPKLIKGQGIRLYLETPLIIQRIVPHVMDNATGTVTRRGM